MRTDVSATKLPVPVPSDTSHPQPAASLGNPLDEALEPGGAQHEFRGR